MNYTDYDTDAYRPNIWIDMIPKTLIPETRTKNEEHVFYGQLLPDRQESEQLPNSLIYTVELQSEKQAELEESKIHDHESVLRELEEARLLSLEDAIEVASMLAQDEEKQKARLIIEAPCHNRDFVARLFDAVAVSAVKFCFRGAFNEETFYATWLEPKHGPWISAGVFQFIMRRLGISLADAAEEKSAENLTHRSEDLFITYKVFENTYPPELRGWIEMRLKEKRYKDVSKFVYTDWTKPALCLPSADEAMKIMDDTLYGMRDVKRQILMLLELIRRSGKLSYNILLAGPAGVGKTTIAQTIAKLLGLPMSVFPMASIQDAEAFAGFGRTYASSQEGLFTTTVLDAHFERGEGPREPANQIGQVLFLNELDKVPMNAGSRGSVQSILLRMLDDNRSFYDVYHSVSFPLDNVFVVADANDTSLLQAPLCDRFYVVHVKGYTENEKEEIFRRYIFPKAMEEARVEPEELVLEEKAVKIIAATCDEPGVRTLKTVASQIIGDYLLRKKNSESPTVYTEEMVKFFLPRSKRETKCSVTPGRIRSAVACKGEVYPVQIECHLETDTGISTDKIFGVFDAATFQDLEIAIICASGVLCGAEHQIKLQVRGLPDGVSAKGQLGLPAYAAILSAYYGKPIPGFVVGNISLLGQMYFLPQCESDDIISFASKSGVKTIVSALGIRPCLDVRDGVDVVEIESADVFRQIFF